MKHRFTPTPVGRLAGCWWQPGAITPDSAWTYDQARRVLTVSTGPVTTEHCISAHAPLMSDLQRRDVLPEVVLKIARENRVVPPKW